MGRAEERDCFQACRQCKGKPIRGGEACRDWSCPWAWWDGRTLEPVGPVTWRVQLDRSTGPGERGPDAVIPQSPSERARGINIPGLLSFCSPSLLVLHHSSRSQRAKELLDVAVEGCWRAAGDQAAHHPSGALDMWV